MIDQWIDWKLMQMQAHFVKSIKAVFSRTTRMPFDGHSRWNHCPKLKQNQCHVCRVIWVKGTRTSHLQYLLSWWPFT